MKSFFALTTGLLVGLLGTAAMFLYVPEVRDNWNVLADHIQGQ